MKIHKFKNSSVQYNPDTGIFTWIVCFRKPWMDGQPAAREMSNMYLYIKADGKHHSASRLAWNLMNEEPVPDNMQIDHINRVRSDNRIINLRIVTDKENKANVKRYPSETGEIGVSFYHRPGGGGTMFRARYKDKTTYHETLEEAAAGYAKLGSEACD